jgi:adenylosuccinate lyase
LIDRGKTREEAYAMVQKSAMKALKSSKSFLEILKNSSNILKIISSEEIDEVCEMGKLLKQEAIILKRTGI